MPLLNKSSLYSPVYLYLLLHPIAGLSESSFTPTFDLKETFVKNNAAGDSDKYRVTSISPGFLYRLEHSKLDISIDYKLNGLFYHNNSTPNTQNQSLSLLTEFIHNPQKWKSRVFSDITQSVIDADGLQTLNTDTISNNREELRTFGVDSFYSGKLTQSINVDSSVRADYSDFENERSAKGISLNLGLSNQQANRKIFWTVGVSNQQEHSAGESEYINTLQASLNYIIRPRLTGYIQSIYTDTKEANLSQSTNSIGLNWMPHKNSNVSFSIGEREGDLTYSLDSAFTKRKLTLSMNYQEEVTSARSSAIEFIVDSEGLFSTSQITIITPVLQKRADIALNLKGNRTDVTLSWFDQSRFLDSASSANEKIEAIRFNLNRKLSKYSSVSLEVSRQKSKALEINELTEAKLSYQKNLSRDLNLVVNIENSKQESNVLANENEDNILSFNLSISF